MTSYLKSQQNKRQNKIISSKDGDASTALLYLMLFVAFFRETLVLLGVSALSTVLYYAMIVIVAAICGIVILRMFNTKIEIRYILQFVVGVLICVFLLLSNLLSPNFSFSQNGSQMIGIMLLTVFLCCEWIIPVNKGVVDCFLWLNFLTSVILAFGMLLGSNYLGSNLIYRYASTNQAGIITMLVAIQLALQFLVYKKRQNRLVCILTAVMFLLMTVACYLTRSRACLITVILFLFVLIVFGTKKKAVRVISIVLLAVAVLFPLIWVAFFELMGENTDLMLFGKPIFSGRETIWINIIDSVFELPFNLHISELIEGSVTDHSAHNAFWELIWSYSIWFVAVYFGFICSKVTDSYKSVKGKITLAFFVALIVLFLHMCFETTMISGAVNFTIKAFLVIPIMRGVADDVEFESINSSSGLQRSKYLR